MGMVDALTIKTPSLRPALGLLTLAAVLGLSVAARAQVIEIGPDGGAETISGPVVTTDGGRTTLYSAIAQSPIGQPVAKTEVLQAIRETSDNLQISDRLIEAVAWQESRLNQTALSPKGARGVMQLMPGTASQLGVEAGDLKDNIRGGAAYLKQLLGQFDNDLVLTLAAYNAGPGAVQKYGGVPPYRETKAYVAAILARLAASETTTLVARNRP